jgi:hypothetical protein
MTTTVLVPSDEGRAALAALDNVHPVVYDPAGPMPEEAADAEVLVVPFRHIKRTLAAMREMPKQAGGKEAGAKQAGAKQAAGGAGDGGR